MSTSSDADIRPVAARILLTQIGVGVVIALACLGWGSRAGVSALAGAAIGVIANLYMTLTALRPARTPHGALGRLYLGQLIKVVLTVGLLIAVAHVTRVIWPALLAAYAATLVVFWWVPFVSGRRG